MRKGIYLHGTPAVPSVFGWKESCWKHWTGKWANPCLYGASTFQDISENLLPKQISWKDINMASGLRNKWKCWTMGALQEGKRLSVISASVSLPEAVSGSNMQEVVTPLLSVISLFWHFIQFKSGDLNQTFNKALMFFSTVQSYKVCSDTI